MLQFFRGQHAFPLRLSEDNLGKNKEEYSNQDFAPKYTIPIIYF